jgi:ferrochelatase
MSKKRLGVVLFQLGGPDSSAAVEPFLYNLFCDPDIINFTGAFLARRPLARYISRRRAGVVREHYDAIGGHSPIRQLTERQARRLELALAPDFDVRCSIAMRYWHPLTEEAAEAVRSLDLYPQYSFATTLSSLKEWKRIYRPARGAPEPVVIEEFHLHPQYIQGLVGRINTALTHFDDPSKAYLVFSAHGLPLSLIARGDPYQRHVEETVAATVARGGWRNGHTLCYQSRVGRQKWLEPSLTQTLERLPREGKKHLLVIPISFEQALAAGVEKFEMMPALGDAPDFIAALASLVRTALGVRSPEAAHAS